MHKEFFTLLISLALVNNFIVTQYAVKFSGNLTINKTRLAVALGIWATAISLPVGLMGYGLSRSNVFPQAWEFFSPLVLLGLAALLHGGGPLLLQGLMVKGFFVDSCNLVMRSFLPLSIVNTLALTSLSLSATTASSVWQISLILVAVGLGFSALLIVWADFNERLALADAPTPWRGPALTLITAGLMSLGFMGLRGFF